MQLGFNWWIFATPLGDGVGNIVLVLNCTMILRHKASCFSGAPCLSGFSMCLCAVFMQHLPVGIHDC